MSRYIRPSSGGKLPTWNLALYAANYTPLANLTAASFPATASEITSNTEGYTEATRPIWTPSAPSANTIDNLANKAAFTIATASSLVVNGAALLSESAKGAVTGKLVSATKFDNLANKAAFTIATASSLTVNGAALLSESAKGAVTGKLVSATKFAAARTLYNTDVFNLAYRVQLTSS